MVSFRGYPFRQGYYPDLYTLVRALPLSYRRVEDLVKERGVPVDHAAINHWVLKYSVQLEEVFHRRKYPVWISWRTDKTDIHPRQTGVVVFVSRGRLPWLSD